MTKNNILVEYFKKGITYQKLIENLENFIKHGEGDSFSEMDREKYQYSKLNLQRYSRIRKTYRVPEEMKKIITEIKSNQNWLVLTEHWCGDSAQIIPYLNKMVELNSNIKMRFLFRDQNSDLMNSLLTEGKQSIPKIIAFDDNGNELFQWGPRPKEVIKLFAEEKAAGLAIKEILNKVHLWYSRNRGKALELEFSNILSKFS